MKNRSVYLDTEQKIVVLKKTVGTVKISVEKLSKGGRGT
jgi:hypothetical protein